MRTSSSRCLSLALMVAFVSLFLMLSVPRSATATGTSSLTIWGYVLDVGDNPVSGASVTVLIVETSATSTDPDGSASNGAYQIDPEFDPSEYSIGNTIRVTAVSSLGTKIVETPVTSDMDTTGLGQVDVKYTTAIPEFGSMYGVLISTFAIGVVVVVVLGRKRA